MLTGGLAPDPMCKLNLGGWGWNHVIVFAFVFVLLSMKPVVCFFVFVASGF